MQNRLQNILDRSLEANSFVVNQIEKMASDQLTYQPNSKKWSILEIMDHLNIIYDIYLPNLMATLEEAGSNDQEVQREETTMLAKLAIRMTAPKGEKRTWKLKTLNYLAPKELKLLDKDIVFEKFKTNKNTFSQLIHQAAQKNLNGLKVATSLGQRVKFYIPECLEFVMVHEERHLQQIKEIRTSFLLG